MPASSLPPPAKKRKVKPDADLPKKLEAEITAAATSDGSLNPLLDLLNLAQGASDAADLSKIIYSLYRVFVVIICSEKIAPGGGDAAKQVRKWMWRRLDTFVDLLVGLLQDEEPALRKSALDILFSLLRHLSSSLSKVSSDGRPQFHHSHFKHIVHGLLICPPSPRSSLTVTCEGKLIPDVRDHFVATWLSVYDDVRWCFLREASSVLSRFPAAEHPNLAANLLSLVERLTTFPTDASELNAWWISELGGKPFALRSDKPAADDDDDLAMSDSENEDNWRKFFDEQPKAKDIKKSTDIKGRVHQLSFHQSLHSLKAHRAVFTRMWLGLLPRLSLDTLATSRSPTIRALNIMHRGILPHLTRPVLVMDWISACVDIGGTVGLLALNALFTLMKDYNLDYPQFYTRLYTFLDKDVLHLKHRARFFRLTELFLSSTHLPAALLASFVKRLSRLSLSAPPAAIIMIIPFTYNILKRHPALMKMIHRADGDGDEPFNDTYIADETNPNVTNAIDSSLWELLSHRQHYDAAVSTLARIFEEAFTKPGYSMEDFLDHTYGTLLETEFQRKIKKEPALATELVKDPFLLRTDLVFEADKGIANDSRDMISELYMKREWMGLIVSEYSKCECSLVESLRACIESQPAPHWLLEISISGIILMDSIRVSKVEKVLCGKSGSAHYGSLHLTAHHLIFRYEDAAMEEMWVPYPLISLVVQLPQTLQGQSPITFHTRTFETFSLLFGSDRDAIDVFESVKELTVCTSVNQLYAFFYSPNPPFDAEGGWSVYSPRREFGRMGVGTRTKAWRFTDINKDYQFSSTYPSLLVVPTRISDSTLTYAAKYRSKCRIPALTYLHWANFGTITRSSQPMVGIKQNRSVQDEKLVEAIFQSHRFPDSRSSSTPIYGATATNLIVDARPTANAMANTARGAGTENMENYKDAKKTYSGIDHIHAMRESLGKVVDALREADVVAASASGKVLGEAKQLTILDRQALRRSGWLRHLSNILEAVALIVRNVHINSSHVLVHCSDGWDRTSQLAALAQVCLDPYYRTMRGFQVLVEKDWISFGHRFRDRCGHLSSEKFFTSVPDSGNVGGGAEAAQAFLTSVQNRFASQHHIKETSPTFHQFLECLRQVQRQFPERFEFNERFLRTIHYHLYSCQFGTFLYNNEQERRRGEDNMAPSERTASLWDFLNSSSQVELHKNPSYNPLLDDLSNRDSKADMGVLTPNAKDIRFWHELYGRTDEEMNGKIIMSQVKEDSEFVPSIEGLDDDPVNFHARTEAVPSVTHPQPTTITSSPTLVRSSSPVASEGLSSSLQGLWSSLPEFGQKVGGGFLAATTPTGLGGTPPRPSSPGRMRSPNAPDFFTNSGVKSMWGKLSSNATAAFTAVQEVYDGVTKDFKEASRPFEDDNWNYSRGRELQTSGFSVDGERFTSRGSTSFSPVGSSSRPWDSVIPQGSLADLAMDNPWSSVRSPSPPPLATPRDMDDTGPLPEDPTVTQSSKRQNSAFYHPPKQGPSVGRVTHTNESNVPEQETKRPSLTTDPLGVGPV